MEGRNGHEQPPDGDQQVRERQQQQEIEAEDLAIVAYYYYHLDGPARDVDAGEEEEEEEVSDSDDDDDDDGHEEEEEEEEEEEPIPEIMSQNDTRRMRLTSEEKDWAVVIKMRVEINPEIDNLTDYDYGQWALICKNNVGDAIERIKQLQEFRNEYDILDTLEDGIRAIRGFLELFPRHWLQFSFSQEDGVYVHINDMSQFDTSVLNTSRKVKIYYAAIYYILHAATPDMATIRKGGISIMDCMDVQWTRKQDFKLYAKLIRELMPNYPTKLGGGLFYNTGVIVNSLLTVIKQAMPAEMKRNFYFGITTDDSMASFFLMPNLEAANERVLRQISETLQRRYTNVESFSLNVESNDLPEEDDSRQVTP